jgi:carboxyl-terminal processing protease
MRRLLALLILVVAACGGPSAEPSTTTSATSVTAPRATVTTQPERIPLEIQDCTAPQVGFAPLCEAYELVQEWHMDRPIDANKLSDAALSGLEAFTTDATEPVPRTLFCAIPDPAFTSMCELLADRVSESAIPVGEAIEAALVTMASTGLEQFSYYVPPELVGSYRLNGVVGGIGVLLDARDAAGSKCVRVSAACPLEIVIVLEDNPGAAAGLAPGDQIISVDGEAVDGQGFVDTATRIAGDETGSVEIEVVRGGETLPLTITRAPLTIPTVEIDIPRPGIGYLSIPDFEEDISGLVTEGLTQLGEGSIGRLVLDLRDNPGGYVDSAIDVASAFIDGEVVLETVGPGQDFEYESATGGLFTRLDIAVLVNAGTASAAEILAAALRDQKGAEIIGEPTFGKDAVQLAFDLNNGGQFNVAVARWLSPGGTSVAGTGVLPDRTVHIPASMSTAELADLAFR